MRRLLIINNVPTHYRTFMFDTMGARGAEHGVDVTVAFQAEYEKGRPWFKDRPPMKVRHFVSKGLNPFARGTQQWFTQRTFNTDILRSVAGGEYDWVLMAPFMSAGTWTIALWPTRTRKLLWSESNLDSTRHLHGPGLWFKRLLLSPFSVLVCPGQRAVDYVRRIRPGMASKPVLWLPNIVDTALYDTRVREHRAQREQIRAQLGVGPGDVLVVGTGQMIERKGYHLLLEAAAAVPGSYRVILVGDGPFRQEWQARIDALGAGERIRLPGAESPENIARFLAAADWFVHPALQDPSPLVIVEAAVAGLPLAVSTQTGNAPEAVVEGENGFTFDPTDPAAMRRTLERIAASSPQDRLRLGRRSAELARERFDPVPTVDRFFKGLLGQG